MTPRALLTVVAVVTFSVTSVVTGQSLLQAPNPAGPCYMNIQSGSGNDFWRVCLSRTGNLTRWENPQGVEHLNVGTAIEGWSVCRNPFEPPEGGFPVNQNAWDYDAGRENGLDAFFASSGLAQPNGQNTFPFTVITNLGNGLRLTQTFVADKGRRALRIDMRVTNISPRFISFIAVQRMIDVDMNGSPDDDVAIWTRNSVAVTTNTASPLLERAYGHGLMLTAEPPTNTHIGSRAWVDTYPAGQPVDQQHACLGYPYEYQWYPKGWDTATIGEQDVMAGALFNLGDSLRPTGSETFSFTYRAF
jgi:hypothetical protein